MNSLVFSLIALACILGGVLIGMSFRVFLPQDHLSDDSKDIVKVGTAMIATRGALVLGLLIASAKGNFDMVSSGLREIGAKVILLDRTLTHYGPETNEVRGLLRHAVSLVIKQNWPEDAKVVAIAKVSDSVDVLEDLQNNLQQMSPRNDTQSKLKSKAIQISGEIDQARWLIVEQRGMSSLPLTFLIIIVSWFTIIFSSFGLLAPRNATVIVVLLVCALSVACALFLMLELDRPYGGMVKVSSAPLLEALKHIGR